MDDDASVAGVDMHLMGLAGVHGGCVDASAGATGDIVGLLPMLGDSCARASASVLQGACESCVSTRLGSIGANDEAGEASMEVASGDASGNVWGDHNSEKSDFVGVQVDVSLCCTMWLLSAARTLFDLRHEGDATGSRFARSAACKR